MPLRTAAANRAAILAPHGAGPRHRNRLGTTTGVQIYARFDDGTPMANAQVLVYAPDDPETPWLRGEADDEGYFAFVPNAALAGRWDINVRTAGHGDWVYLTLEDGGRDRSSQQQRLHHGADRVDERGDCLGLYWHGPLLPPRAAARRVDSDRHGPR